MAQLNYRANLSAKVFPFLSSQFGQTVIVTGSDQASQFNDGSGGDSNIPQAYYMHNVVPTPQGYKSVGYKSILPAIGVTFDRVIAIRDPNMERGWIGITSSGGVYMYRAGELGWTNVTMQVPGWSGGSVSVAYANGFTYICFTGFKVFKLSTADKTLTEVIFSGIINAGIVAITSSANYLILTDGVTIYWSSTITPEDFIPSLTTGAGSGKPSDVEGNIVALVPLSNGFAIYTAVNVVIASYSQNARFPFIYQGAKNSRGVSSVQHITYAGDEGSNYAWTSAGLQKIIGTGATVIMPEVTDFLIGQELEDFHAGSNTLTSYYLTEPLKVKLAFIGARYLIVSYGAVSLTHALVYDTALKRWGKLKCAHVACFEITLNSDGQLTTSTSASAKKTIGFVSATGEVTVCNFDNDVVAEDSVLMLGKYQIIRSRLTTLQGVSMECIDPKANFEVYVNSTLDGKTLLAPIKLVSSNIGSKIRDYAARVTGINHSILIKGSFNLNSFELILTLHGRR